MTARTLLLLVGWAVHPAQMWILMTVQAGLRSEAKLRHLGRIRNSSAGASDRPLGGESRRCHLPVAGVARYGQMCPLQRKIGLLMSLERIEDRNEAVDGVTTLAFNATHRVRELAQMGIPMAIGAFAETRDPHRTPGSMTLVAPHRPMLSNQRESRPVVIETTAVDLLPGCRGVASPAAASQSADMGISMAVGAATVREPCETELTHRNLRTWRGTRSVALDTGHLKVSTGEDELGPVVIKSIHRLPTLQRVTRLAALGRKLLLVCVLVAGQTGLFL